VKYININGVQFYNNKINIRIPLNTFVVIAGRSGSGKSNLIKNSIDLEFKNLYLNTLPGYYTNDNYVFKKQFQQITNLHPVIFLSYEDLYNTSNISIGEFLNIYNDLVVLFFYTSKPYSYKTNELIKSCYDNNKIKNIIINHFLLKKIKILTFFIKNSTINYKNFILFLNKNKVKEIRINGFFILTKNLVETSKNRLYNIELVVGEQLIYKTNNKILHDKLIDIISKASYFDYDIILIYDIKYNKTHILNKKILSEKECISYKNPTLNSFSFYSKINYCTSCKGTGLLYNIRFKNILMNNSYNFLKIIKLNNLYRYDKLFYKLFNILNIHYNDLIQNTSNYILYQIQTIFNAICIKNLIFINQDSKEKNFFYMC
jgi:excinuclease ABC subunit A